MSLANKRRFRTTSINSIKKLFEKAFSCINTYDSVEDAAESLSSFQDTLVEKFKKIEQFNDEIMYQIEDDAELEFEEETSTEFSVYFRKNILLITKFIEKVNSSKSDANASTSSQSKSYSVKLPKINLKPFNGQPENWLSFYENFECAIANNNDLSGIQKLTYLRSLVEGQASSTIKGLALTNSNFDVAMNLLKERYNNKQLLISAHMTSLLSLDKVIDIRDVSKLRKTYDNLEIQIRSLENLDITSSMYGPLLVPILMQKLPEELNLIISRQFQGCDSWDIKTILEIFKSELQAHEKSISNASAYDRRPLSIETLHSSSSYNNIKNYSTSYNKHLEKNESFKCAFCSKNHLSQQCMSVTQLDARRKILKDKKRCFICLRIGHISSKCLSRIKCYECSERHHSAMCDKKNQLRLPDNQLTSVAGVSKGNSVLLQTALVTIISGTTELRNCRILFDSCSQLSYVSPSIRERLHLETIDQKKISIKTFGNQCITENLEKVQFCVLDINGARIPISCFVKDICAPINGQNIKFAIENYSHLKDLRLADSHFAEGNVRVDILIGADFYWSIVDNEIIRGIEGPVAIKSKVGFLLSGNIFGISDSCGVFHSHILEIASEFCNDKTVFHNSMSSFWDSETIGTTRSDINNLVYENFKNEIQFNKHSNRYEVGLPFKLNHDLISDNYTYCIKRLAPVLKKLSKDNKLLTSYNAIIKEQLTQGVIEKVNNHEISYGDVHYLPHRPVIRDDKSTTKVRMVFDASATIDGPSLNDCLNAGPSLTTSLFGVLLRFRCNKYAFISDIEKAFLQISLKEKDRDFVRFLWVDNLDSENGQDLLSSPIVTYRLCRVLFGVTSSPFLLSATLVTHLQKYTEIDQEFVEKMLLSLHVDDLNSGSNDLNQCLEFFNKARNYLQEANFNLRKFESNSVELEQKIQSNNYERNNTTKVLGQAWDKDLDELTYSFNDILETVKKIPTKRDVMKFIASIFDPMGIINPIVVRCKCFFQRLCVEKFSWDDLLFGSTLDEWNDIILDFRSLNKLSLPRWILTDSYLSNTNIKLEFHAFADASLKAFGCCIYLRCIVNESQCFVSLIASKSRVAPINKSTIPRLELRAMALLSSLMSTVRKELKNLNIDDIFCWTDSTICLHWLNNTNQTYETFVQNRLIQIRDLFPIQFWHYVETSRNPADIISRGCSFKYIIDHDIWFNGPDYLNDVSVPWPSYNLIEHTDNENNLCLVAATNSIDINLEFIDIERFSSYERLNRVTGWILRFVNNLKSHVQKTHVTMTPTLSADEIECAKILWVRYEQRDVMKSKNYKQFRRDLGLQEIDGVVRCHGRMQNAPIPKEAKFPIFVPRSSQLSKLLIVYFHKLVKHNGLKETLTELRTKFWIPQCRQLVRNIILKCFLCQYFEGKPYMYPPSPPLPLSRLCDDYPFMHTAVDYAGPVFVKNIYGDCDTMFNGWIFLFTCASTRSICLDLVSDLSSTSCIRGLRRFFARRGVPSKILSDNGTQFVAEQTQLFASNKSIDWQFNVPAAPWWGGLFERMIRMVKRCLKKVVGKARLNYEQMLTLLQEIETVINNRPLTFVYNEPCVEALTPNHLVFGRKLNLNGVNSDSNIEHDLNKRYNHLQTVLEHFIKRWKSEYLTELREFHKSKRSIGSVQINIGDIVLIEEDKKSRLLWKTAKVEKILASSDGCSRAATVKYLQGDGSFRHVNRPINKLVPVEYANQKEGINELKVTFVNENNIPLVIKH
ncbi:uncharacterized protein LOC136081405 [Hydra vulgaris]|uniref:Uncharacterized protein LOC136081405 n=1 Tax=Hydra vulgaris TaxID=6087 RepID=A0ABM4BZU9_HYDVU